MSNQESNPQDQTPPTVLPGANQAKTPPEVNPIPAVANNGGDRQTFPQLYGFTEGYPASGPWSFHEHRLFEQGCIRFGWGQWKDIQATIPGRSKDQCKSHGQKYLKQHPNEKIRLTKEHLKYLRLQLQKAEKHTLLPQGAKASATKRAPPEQKAGKSSKKKAKKADKSDKTPITFKKEQPSKGGGQKFSTNSIDTICNDIYERKKSAGCKMFPLCLCEKTPCAREGLDYKFHVGRQALHSAVASAFVEGDGAVDAKNNLEEQNS